MKKVAILVDQLYKHGGIEKLVAIKANYWSYKFGYNVDIISSSNQNNAFVYDLSEKVNHYDLAIDYNINKSYFSLQNLLKLSINLVRLQLYIVKHRPDFILVASHIPITYILPFLYRGKAQLIKEFHFTKFFRNKASLGLKEKLFSFIERMYDHIVVLSKEERSFYKTNNVRVIPNPISETAITPIQDPKEKLAVAVVRFAPVKRLDRLVQLWELFVTNNNDWKLYVYGPNNNDYAKEIGKLIKDRNLSESIILKGKSDNVLEKIVKGRVLLLTSEQECFPMVLLEAQQVGVPVISFDCPTGPRNIIKHRVNGFLAQNDNVIDFVNCLDIFVDDECLQKEMSTNALVMMKNYHIDKIMHIWRKEIFES